ncbi:MAG: GNAT family N-acetyltransferase [Pseudomonadota bacterium]
MIRIVPAGIDHLAGIQACAKAAYALYVDRIGREPAPMVAPFERQIADGLVCAALDEDGTVRGFVTFYPRSDHMHLENVAVSPSYQGRGLGRALIHHCEQQALALGFSTVELYTNARMTENLVLYPRLGYRVTGRRQEDGFDRVFFSKELASPSR